MNLKIKRDVLIRPNETIGFIPCLPYMRLEKVEKKLYSALLLISQEIGDQDEYQYPLTNLCSLCNVSYSNTKRFKQHLINLKMFVMEYNTRTEDVAKLRALGLVLEIGINEDLKQGKKAYLIWSLPKIIREKLIKPKGFLLKSRYK